MTKVEWEYLDIEKITKEKDQFKIYDKRFSSKDKYYKIAIDRGIPTKKEVLGKLKEEGDWSDKEELEIKRQEAFIEQLQKNKTQLVLKSQIEQQNASIHLIR